MKEREKKTDHLTERRQHECSWGARRESKIAQKKGASVSMVGGHNTPDMQRLKKGVEYSWR